MEGNLLWEWEWFRVFVKGTAARRERWIAVLQLELSCLIDSCPALCGIEQVIVSSVGLTFYLYIYYFYVFYTYIYKVRERRNVSLPLLSPRS